MTDGADNLTLVRRTPLVASLQRAMAATPAQRSAGPSEQTVEEETRKAIDAKTSLGSQQAPAMGIVNEALKSAKNADAVKLTADSLKLTAETVAKATPAANSLNAGGNIIDGLNKAAQGDAFGAASAASAAAEKLAPHLANTGVGAIASVVILGTGDNKLSEQAKAFQKSAQRAVSPNATGAQRGKAILDSAIYLQNMANLGRTLVNAALNVGGYGVKLASKSAALAPAASGLRHTAAAVAKSPVGGALRGLNKWIPLVNVAGVAISAKTAIDVFRTRNTSVTTKTLSIASLASAGLALWAGFALPGVAFLGIILGSIGLDLMLGGARKRDGAEGDMDARSVHWLTHPHLAARDLGRWIGAAVPAIAGKVSALGDQARRQLLGADAPTAPNPRRRLT